MKELEKVGRVLNTPRRLGMIVGLIKTEDAEIFQVNLNRLTQLLLTVARNI